MSNKATKENYYSKDKNFFVISIQHFDKVDHNERKTIQKSLVGNLYENKYGMIEKFVKALGFWPVIDDICKDFPVVHSKSVENPDNYITPLDLLFQSIHIDLTSKGLWSFVIPEMYVIHNNIKYSYFTENLAKQFYRFLLKVYPNLRISFNWVKGYNPNLKTKVLDYFYQCMHMTDDVSYTVEISSHRVLSNTEKNFVEQNLREMAQYNFHIEQQFCETCKSYDKDYPYHIEIVYD